RLESSRLISTIGRLWECMDKSRFSNTYGKIAFGRPIAALKVRPAAGDRRRGWLTAGLWTIPVALGRGGILANKREGDGGTPKGVFQPTRLWWRADRHRRPKTFLPIRAIRADDAWCENPVSRHYNRPIRLDRGHSGDRLRRDDHLYDFIIEIDHNTR